MRKTDKKIDNQLRIELTDVCETALKEIEGFQWLTHLVDYSNFPKSLRVVCVFDTNDNLSSFMGAGAEEGLNALIEKKLLGMGIQFKQVGKHITYDTEENCLRSHNGKWADRLN